MKKLLLATPVLLTFFLNIGCKDSDSMKQDSVRKFPQSNLAKVPSKEEVIEAHLAAVGGVDALKKVEDYTRVSTITVEDSTGESNGTFHEVFDLVNDRSRVDLDLGTYKEAKAWQGQRGWKVTTFEPLRVLRPDEIAVERITVPLSSVHGILDSFGIDAFLQPVRVEFNGKSCIKLNFIGSALDIYINERTNLIEGYLIPEFMQLTLSDYKKIDGVMMFTSEKAEIFGLNTKYDLKVKKIEFNVDVDAAKFDKPVG